MASIRLADAKARLSDLVNKVEAGDTVEITRHGKPVARLTPVGRQRKRVDLAMLEKLTAIIKPQRQSAADAIRSQRDSDRF